jgi:hypothetical protein
MERELPLSSLYRWLTLVDADPEGMLKVLEVYRMACDMLICWCRLKKIAIEKNKTVFELLDEIEKRYGQSLE